ncbi:MAG: hypothetical protein NTV56_01105 [Alphaproteobacteria bacterium]|nr:hypothetical protein [Alphaproteobacteria bacterium]
MVILVARIRNRSSQPAYHVFVEVLIDTSLPTAFSVEPYRMASEEDGMRVFKYNVQSPPNIPIFKEGDPVNHQGSIALKVSQRLAYTAGATAKLKTRVQTPGFVGEIDWRIRFENGTLTLARV